MPPSALRPIDFKNQRTGMTLAELLVASAVSAILAMTVIPYLYHSFKTYRFHLIRMQANQEIRSFSEVIRLDLFRIVDVAEAKATVGTFILDSAPLFNPSGDSDGDSLINEIDPDVDGDQWVIATSSNTAWRVGNNRDDDDDDNDGRVDVVLRYRWEGKKLLRTLATNPAVVPPPSTNESAVAENVCRFSITYEGSTQYNAGQVLDVNPRDGFVQPSEIDAGVGNNDGIAFNTRAELAAISIIRVEIGIDSNNDGVEDASTLISVTPPLLPLKRKY